MEKAKKYLIFDAGPLISLTMSGLLPVLEKLKQNFSGEFILTPQVKREVIDKPRTIKKYKLESFMIQNLFDKGILRLSSDFVQNQVLEKETFRILKTLNSSFKAFGKNVELIQTGEASCIAFSQLCKCDSVIVIDERTARLLIEAPENLKEIMEHKLHTKINFDKQNIKPLKDLLFIRSAELIYIAYKKNLIDIKDGKDLLQALLYSLKYKGTAISTEEINEISEIN